MTYETCLNWLSLNKLVDRDFTLEQIETLEIMKRVTNEADIQTKVEKAFKNLKITQIKTFQDTIDIAKYLYFPFGDNAYFFLLMMDILLTGASSISSWFFLRDIIDEISTSSIDLGSKYFIYNVSVFSRFLTIFQIAMAFERFYSIKRLLNINRPSKQRVLGLICKSIVFEEGLEIMNFIIQIWL